MDGRLYEKIKQRVKELIEDDFTGYSFEKDFQPILDEAANDFPHRKLMYVGKESKLSDVYTTVQGEAYPIRCFDCSEINTWRTKYFGKLEKYIK